MWVIGLAALVAAVLGSTLWAVHMFRIATRDSLELAAKLTVARPRRACDWPELRVDAVIVDPEASDRALVFVHWPAHPERRALLTIEVSGHGQSAHRLLNQWRDTRASVSPSVGLDDTLVLRRRRTNDSVCARVIREASVNIAR